MRQSILVGRELGVEKKTAVVGGRGGGNREGDGRGENSLKFVFLCRETVASCKLFPQKKFQ